MNTRSRPVFVVDDDDSVRGALSRMLGAAGFDVRAFASGEELLASAGAESPGCAVLDMVLPGVGGLGIQEALLGWSVPPAVVFLSGEADIPTSVRAMKAGAVDFLTKPVDGQRLIDAVRRGVASHTAAMGREAEMGELRGRADTLTPRECEVMWLVADGMPNKKIGVSLGVGEKTVKAHRAKVMSKMGAGSLPDLVRMADRLGAAGRA